jgi:hypothetical protein
MRIILSGEIHITALIREKFERITDNMKQLEMEKYFSESEEEKWQAREEKNNTKGK